ncbi:hypothetical protein FS837_010835 [Tulasnella sp. UAMH 9824]|nr:hypothetical protein FS837_010835 [Tulasnella sp. UAMH 9824]
MEEVSSPRLSSDVWSWACLALVALTDTSPYDQVKMDIGIVLAMSKGQRPAEVQSLRIPAPHLKQLLTQCWDFEPDGRPSAADCLRIIESALAMVSDFPELDFNLPEKQLQHLQHILIDISRLKEEIRFPSEHIHARICTLDPGTPTSKLVTARTDHFMPERKRTRLALRFARQLEFRAALQHPHILPVLGGYLDRKGMAAVFISEYQAGGDLKKFLEQEKPAWTTRLQLVRDMIDGLCYLHAKAIPHGDLNMGNVVISADRKAMLADFGPSKAPDDSPAELDSDGLDAAARYRSPELADKEENYWDRLPPDIWAWGCLALETLTDTLPYADEEAPTAILDAVLNGKPPAQVENLDISVPDLRLLLSRCWAFEPEARPSARDCRHILDSALTIIPIPAETYLTPLVRQCF